MRLTDESKGIKERIKTHKGQAKEYKNTLLAAYKRTVRLKSKLAKTRRREALKLGKTMEELKEDAIEVSDEFKAKQRELREFIDENRETMMQEINHDVGEIKDMADAIIKMKEAKAEAKAQKDAEKAEEKARKEAEKAKKAEDKARKEAEKAEEKARKAEEKARKEAEKAAKKKA
jgi:hypothetical protein